MPYVPVAQLKDYVGKELGRSEWRTIAHGFLSLSLMPKLMEDILIMPEGLKMAVNYGLDSVRFIQPVKVNSKVRLNVTLTDVTEKKPGQWLFKATATLEIEGQEN